MAESRIPASLNPDCFPAKLWQLVNNPQVESVQWDDRGEGLLIDEHLFLREVLEPEGGDSIFKTKSFPSFIRQLNLYGFHKVAKQTVAAWTGAGDAAGTAWVRHHFYSPHFKQHRPELLAHIKRLTKTNRAKLEFHPNHGQPRCNNSLTPPVTFSNVSSSGQPPASQPPASQPPASQPADNQAATSTQSNTVAQAANLNDIVLCQWPLELIQGNGAHSSLECYGVGFAVRQVTQVTYTVHLVCSVLPPHTWSGSLTKTPQSSSEPAFAPWSSSAAAPQLPSPLAQTDPLTASVLSSLDIDVNFSLFQEAAGEEYENNAAVVDGNQLAGDLLFEFVDEPKAQDRKREYSLIVNDSPDLYLLESPAAKWYCMDDKTGEKQLPDGLLALSPVLHPQF